MCRTILSSNVCQTILKRFCGKDRHENFNWAKYTLSRQYYNNNACIAIVCGDTVVMFVVKGFLVGELIYK